MPPQFTPSCPRCGYDQSGAMSTWSIDQAQSCPLRGLCSECGLEFDWHDVIYADRLRVPGFVEQTPRASLFAAWRTWAWTIWPWAFWSRVRIEHPVIVGRLWLWLLLVFGPLQAWHAMHAVAGRLWFKQFAGGWNVFRPMGWDGIVTEACAPVLSYDPGWFVTPWWAEPFETVLRPIRGWSSVFDGLHPGFMTQPPYLGPLALLTLLMPMMLLCLPRTRTQAKVRLVHVFRASVYSTSWLVMMALLRAVGEASWWIGSGLKVFAPRYYGSRGRPGFLDIRMPFFDDVLDHGVAVSVTVILWLGAWWYATIGRGLRIRHAPIVWLAVFVPSVMIFAIVMSMVSEEFALWLDILARGRLQWPR